MLETRTLERPIAPIVAGVVVERVVEAPVLLVRTGRVRIELFTEVRAAAGCCHDTRLTRGRVAEGNAR
jgi:hypothetical protein